MSPDRGAAANGAPATQQQQQQKRRGGDRDTGIGCFAALITFAGHAFSVLTVLINIADVATDIVVAVQFKQDGETTWFWLVMASLIVSHGVYTVVGAELLPRNIIYDPWWSDCPRLVRWLVALVLAQFVPIINLVVETCLRVRDRDDAEVFEDDEGPDPAFRVADSSITPEVTIGDAQLRANAMPGTERLRRGRARTRAAEEEIDDVRRSQYLQARMAAALEEHFERYGLFYVESAVEAAPQAIIQLLAITFLGRASAAQLVSLCCSLFSITSKAVVVSQAYDARVMAFKFALAAHDVFSTFYLFSTLVARETSKDASFFGLAVSWLGYVWLWKLVITAGLGVVGGFLGLLRVLSEDSTIENRVMSILAFFGSLLLAGPIALLYELAKLVWLVWYMAMVEPMRRKWPVFALLHSFTAKDDADTSRLRHVCISAYKGEEALLLGTAPAVGSAMYRRAQRRARRRKTTIGALRRGMMAEEMRRLFDLATAPAPLTFWGVRRVFHPRQKVDFENCICGDVDALDMLIMIWMGFAAPVGILGQLFSLAYPFANAAREFHGHNILQATCFYATCAALFIALLLAYWAYTYWRFNVTMNVPIGRGITTYSDAVAAVAKYHEPPYVGVLQELVPVDVLPAELTGVVGAYLEPADIGLADLTIAETEALKRRIADRGPLSTLDVVATTNAGDADDGAGGVELRQRSPSTSSPTSSSPTSSPVLSSPPSDGAAVAHDADDQPPRSTRRSSSQANSTPHSEPYGTP